MIVPASRPQMTRTRMEALLTEWRLATQVPMLVGLRGYYRDTMGAPGENDRGIYDDALIFLSPSSFATFNANTDPSRTGGALAVLQEGVWRYQLGTHHPGTPGAYPCLVQADPVAVCRDNGVREVGEFYIHIHRGGYTTTSSEGCQTIYPDQWDEFFGLVSREMAQYHLRDIEYVLRTAPQTP